LCSLKKRKKRKGKKEKRRQRINEDGVEEDKKSK